MLSVFALPKAFRGHFATIQRNAIRSWVTLRPHCQVLLFGDEEGTAEVAREFGVCHVPDVARNEYGTPLLNDVFEKAEQWARHDVLCYVNCDILLMSDFFHAVDKVSRWRKRFLMVGQCWDLEISESLAFDQPDWEGCLRGLVRQKGEPRGGSNGKYYIDYFTFPRNFYQHLPPFALGRPYFDNWLIWKARSIKAAVVDATYVVTPVHQNHDYSHVRGGLDWVYNGEEAKRNLDLAGGWAHIYTTHDATHCLTPIALRLNWRRYSLLKTRRPRPKSQLSVIAWQFLWWVVELTRPIRHLIGLNMPNFVRLIRPIEPLARRMWERLNPAARRERIYRQHGQ